MLNWCEFGAPPIPHALWGWWVGIVSLAWPSTRRLHHNRCLVDVHSPLPWVMSSTWPLPCACSSWPWTPIAPQSTCDQVEDQRGTMWHSPRWTPSPPTLPSFSLGYAWARRMRQTHQTSPCVVPQPSMCMVRIVQQGRPDDVVDVANAKQHVIVMVSLKVIIVSIGI